MPAPPSPADPSPSVRAGALDCWLIGETSLAVECGRRLLARGHRILGVVSADPVLRTWAAGANVPLYHPSGNLLGLLAAAPFDVLWSIVNPTILTDAVLAMPRLVAINYHDAPLPRYGGVHATTWALWNGEKEHGVTWHAMKGRVDAGDILAQKLFPIDPAETTLSLNARCYSAALELFERLLDDLQQGRLRRVPQDLSRRTFFGRRRRLPDAGLLDWNLPAERLAGHVRALHFGPYANAVGIPRIWHPGLSELLLVGSAEVVTAAHASTPPGTVVAAGSNGVTVSCEGGALRLSGLCDADGEPIAAERFGVGGDLASASLIPSSRLRADLAALDRASAPHERFWVDRLHSLEPAVHPWVGAASSLPASTATLEVFPRERSPYDPATLIAAYAVYLTRVTHRERLDLGLVVDREGQPARAFLSGVVPFRVVFSGEPAFAEVREAVAAELSAAHAQGSFPRDVRARYPGLRDTPPAERALLLRVALGSKPPEDPGALTLWIPPAPDEARWLYDPNRLPPELAERVSRHCRTLLEGLVADPAERIGAAPLMDEIEHRRVAASCRTSFTAYPRNSTVHDLFDQVAAANPSRTALQWREDRVTYAQLRQRSLSLQAALAAAGVSASQRVAVCLERGPDLPAALLAVLRCGAAYLPIEPDYPAERFRFLLDDARCPVMLTQRSLAGRLATVGSRILCVEDYPSAHAGVVAAGAVQAVDPAYVMYTSGSTGLPKGVVVSHRGIVRLARSADYADFGPDQVFLQFAPISFDACTLELWAPLLNGGAVAICSPGTRSLAELARFLASSGATTAWLTAALFHAIVDEHPEAAGALRQLLTGGDVVSPAHSARFLRLNPNCRLINGYGPTENTTFTCCFPIPPDWPPSEALPIGRPIPNTSVVLLDRFGGLLPEGIPGELCTGGDGVALGYLDRPDLTRDRFIPDPFAESTSDEPSPRLYRTGDLARRRPDGAYEFLGRMDDQVKIRGFRVEPGEIAACLAQHPAVRDCAAVVFIDPAGSPRLAAYAVAAPDATLEPNALRDWLVARLPDHMVPASVTLLEALPIGANGKLDRSALPPPPAANRRADREEPRSPVEERLAAIWADVLGLERVGIHDNFFELGGDSIHSLRILARAARVGIHLDHGEFFRHQTVAGLARVARTGLPESEERGPECGEVALTPIQHWFFAGQPPDPERFAQVLALRADAGLRLETLQQALDILLSHHDALRARFRRDRDTWRQEIPGAGGAAALRSVPESAGREAAVDLACSCLDPTEGRMLAVVVTTGPDGRPQRLYFAGHHLVLDGVSWRILLEDMCTAYDALESERPVRLPPRTVGVREWAARLREFSASAALRDDRAYADAARSWPVEETALSPASDLVRDERRLGVSLTPAETRALLQEAPAAYRTQVNDLLLAALALAWRDVGRRSAVLVDLEGHGREPLDEPVDLSRTVGWFTSMFPVRLVLPQGAGEGNAIRCVKEQLRAVPRRGFGYGLVRYLDPDRDPGDARWPRPPVAFNYLGRMEIPESPPFAQPADWQWIGLLRGPDQRRGHPIEVEGLVASGRLELTWSYNDRLCPREEIEALASAYLDQLRRVITHCLDPNAGGVTPSDFPDLNLSQEELDALLPELAS